MTKEFTDCPNCGTHLKSGLLSSVKLINEWKTDVINEYHSNKSTAYCTKCGGDLFSKYVDKLTSEQTEIRQKIQRALSFIPVISIHSPINWDYDVLSIVTGQSTTGTGVISDFTSSFTDLFGVQSDRYNRKLKGGEDLCLAQLRKQAIDMGGNAVIGTDIDYSEVGSSTGMLMVCMAGTVIRLKNLSILGEGRGAKIEEVSKFNQRLNVLNRYKTSESL